MGRPRKHPVVARLEPSRPVVVEQAPIRPNIDDTDLRLAVVGRIDPSGLEGILLHDVMMLPRQVGEVRAQTIDRCIRLLEILRGRG